MRFRWLLGFLVSLHSCSVIRADDHFLTIGGGESPTNNQVSLEKNILYLQRFLSDSGLGSMAHDIYFANGSRTSKMTGTATVQKASFNFSGSRFSPVMSHVNASVDHIERPLMTPDEIMRLRPPKKEGNGDSG